MPATGRDRILDKAWEADDERQVETRSVVTNAGPCWSQEDESYLIEHWNRPLNRWGRWSRSFLAAPRPGCEAPRLERK